eukprot:Filipodium_phascolosomae@DN3494_c0_g1_i1.p1
MKYYLMRHREKVVLLLSAVEPASGSSRAMYATTESAVVSLLTSVGIEIWKTVELRVASDLSEQTFTAAVAHPGGMPTTRTGRPGPNQLTALCASGLLTHSSSSANSSAQASMFSTSSGGITSRGLQRGEGYQGNLLTAVGPRKPVPPRQELGAGVLTNTLLSNWLSTQSDKSRRPRRELNRIKTMKKIVF